MLPLNKDFSIAMLDGIETLIGKGTIAKTLVNTELEFRLGNYSKDGFKAEQTYLQFKKMVESLHKILPIAEEDSLDISEKNNNIRTTISGINNIKKYCFFPSFTL